MMRAFKYDNGRAVSVEWTEERMTEAERLWIRHIYAATDTGQRIALYLPVGTEPAGVHVYALEVALAQSRVVCPQCGSTEFPEILRTPMGRTANEARVRCRRCAAEFIMVM